MKGCSTFPKAPALLELQHQIVWCHIQDIRWWWGLTPLQRCCQCILQPQPTGQKLFLSKFASLLWLVFLCSFLFIPRILKLLLPRNLQCGRAFFFIFLIYGVCLCHAWRGNRHQFPYSIIHMSVSFPSLKKSLEFVFIQIFNTNKMRHKFNF